MESRPGMLSGYHIRAPPRRAYSIGFVDLDDGIAVGGCERGDGGDVALGEILYATSRGTLYSAAFLVTMVALGLAQSPWVVMALPVCVLIAIAFGMAAATVQRAIH